MRTETQRRRRSRLSIALLLLLLPSSSGCMYLATYPDLGFERRIDETADLIYYVFPGTIANHGRQTHRTSFGSQYSRNHRRYGHHHGH